MSFPVWDCMHCPVEYFSGTCSCHNSWAPVRRPRSPKTWACIRWPPMAHGASMNTMRGTPTHLPLAILNFETLAGRCACKSFFIVLSIQHQLIQFLERDRSLFVQGAFGYRAQVYRHKHVGILFRK